MTTDLPPIPPAVLEFAQENNIKNLTLIKSIEPETVKNIKHIYAGVGQKPSEFEEQKEYLYTHYIHILVDKNKVRFATPKEEEELNRIIFQ